MIEKRIRITVNRRPLSLRAYPMARLLDVLREQLHLTGTKEGCGEGECGACSILLNGKLVNSCLIPMAQVENATITTIEGLAGKSALHPLQTCFLETGGTQCGICAPGMLLAAYSFLKNRGSKRKVSDQDIRKALAGNLCRCTGYLKIIDSVRRCLRSKSI